MHYRLYTFDGNLKSFDDLKHNIVGWYENENIAFGDYNRAKSLYPHQFVLVQFDNIPTIIAISNRWTLTKKV